MKKYENYVSALKSLRKAPEQDLSNDFIQSGIIDKFELQFQYYDFMDESLWLCMLRDRNDSAHIYDEERARRLVDAIIVDYIPEFERVNQGLVIRYGEALND